MFVMAAASLCWPLLLLLFLLTAFRRTDPGLARPINSRGSRLGLCPSPTLPPSCQLHISTLCPARRPLRCSSLPFLRFAAPWPGIARLARCPHARLHRRSVARRIGGIALPPLCQLAPRQPLLPHQRWAACIGDAPCPIYTRQSAGGPTTWLQRRRMRRGLAIGLAIGLVCRL